MSSKIVKRLLANLKPEDEKSGALKRTKTKKIKKPIDSKKETEKSQKAVYAANLQYLATTSNTADVTRDLMNKVHRYYMKALYPKPLHMLGAYSIWYNVGRHLRRQFPRPRRSKKRKGEHGKSEQQT
jgi:hypothetical protein